MPRRTLDFGDGQHPVPEALHDRPVTADALAPSWRWIQERVEDGTVYVVRESDCQGDYHDDPERSICKGHPENATLADCYACAGAWYWYQDGDFGPDETDLAGEMESEGANALWFVSWKKDPSGTEPMPLPLRPDETLTWPDFCPSCGEDVTMHGSGARAIAICGFDVYLDSTEPYEDTESTGNLDVGPTREVHCPECYVALQPVRRGVDHETD